MDSSSEDVMDSSLEKAIGACQAKLNELQQLKQTEEEERKARTQEKVKSFLLLRNWQWNRTSKQAEEEFSALQLKVLEVLSARDCVEVLQQQSDLSRSNQHWQAILKLDYQLQEQADVIAEAVDLTKWRKSIRNRTKGWWWSLPSVHPWNRLDWVWNWLSICCFAASVGLLLNIASRVFTGGIDPIGGIAIVLQSVLTVLTAKSVLVLTESGKSGFEQILQSFKVPQIYWSKLKFFISSFVLLILFLIWLGLPRFSYYSQDGERARQKGDLSSAETSLKRALALNPDDSDTRNRLGLIYENLNAFEQAKVEYRYAAEGNNPKGYNNLARLYILEAEAEEMKESKPEKRKYWDAIVLLDEGASRIECNPAIKEISVSQKLECSQQKYTFFKNRGWAYLQLNLLLPAKNELEQAIEISEQNLENPGNWGSAYCLLAEIYRKQSNFQEELRQINSCIAQNPAEFPEEKRWYLMARQRKKELKKFLIKNH